MKSILGIFCLLTFLGISRSQEPEPGAIPEANRLYAEGSYHKAWEIYNSITLSNLPPERQRWMQFRTADSLWRSETASEKADQTATEQAIRTLQELAKDGPPRDPTGAAIEESLGDYQWQGKRWPDWSDAWPHYRKALEYWAGSTNLAPAAEHYLGIVWKAAKPNQVPHAFNSLHGHNLPTQVLENALRIARTEEERAHAHYLLALALSRDGTDWAKLRRVPSHFRQAIELERDTPWYDDALFHFAESMEQKGRVVRDSHLNWVFQPDYPKAVELYRKLLSDFREGESPYYSQAQQQLANITRPVVNATVPYTFEPGTGIYFDLHWRNVERIEMNLFRVDLTRDIALARARRTDHDWLASIDLRHAEKVRSWTHEPKDSGDHRPGQETIRLEESPAAGAYLLEVSGGGATHREVIMITDLALLLKESAGKTLVWLCEAGSGVPIAQAAVSAWRRQHDGNSWFWTRTEGKTDEQGIAVFPHQAGEMQHGGTIAAASLNGRQAFARVQAHYRYPSDREEHWRIYASTDRPAYRPDEVVHWKATARVHDGQVYGTPVGRDLKMTVLDPRGAEIFQETLKLNSFGSAWGEIPVTSAMPLGVYVVVYSDPGGRQIGRSSLFRLEEYKLPEFKVTVSTPEDEHGRRKTFLAGEAVEAEIRAEYYFGGPVADATVEVVVRQRPFYRLWRSNHEFPWFYDEARHGWGSGGQVIQRESLRTDAFGKTTVNIQSPSNADENLEFIIEARVTDASRREVSAQDSVRVTLQRYQVQAKPEHYLHRPGNEVEVRFTALDANDSPVAAEGTVQVIRDSWVEVWVDPQGREVTGPALAEARRRNPHLPGWEARFQGYEHEHILTRTLKTGTNGLATLAFTPTQEGYYRVTWLSEADPDLQAEVVGRPVEAETAVWVADHESRHIGYHTGGVQIIVDRDTFRAGETAPVMIVAEGNDNHLLLTVEGEELISHQVWHLAGSVKLVQLPIGEEYIPNVRLNVALFSDFRMQADSEEVVVPPVRNFLTLELEPGQEAYRPGEEGRFTLSVKDHAGNPVSAEVALAVADESVFYIQEDLASDPRPFFFGQRNDYRVNTDSSFGFRQYLSKLREQELAREQEALREEVRRTSGFAAGLPAAASTTYFFRDRALNKTMAAPMRGVALGQELSVAHSIAPPMMDAAAAPAESGEISAVQVRSDFRTTIFWEPAVQTDEDGKAEVTLRYPDSLTGWKATARAVTTKNQFGIAHAATRTTQPLMIRLQAPRFFQVADSVTVSAILNNNTGEPLEVRPAIQIEGMAAPENATPAPVTVPAHGEERVDWVVHPAKAGEAKITVMARAEGHSDAMARTYPIQEHGIEKFLAVSGKIRGDAVTVQLDLPAERKPETTLMTVQVTPSLAVTMLDALPYLVHYPYGCTEQTMSRFLPAVITSRTLEKLGLHPEDVMGRAFGGIEEESAAATHPAGRRSLEELDEIVRAGLQRLYDFQHQDGGWGWWKEGDSDPFMTAYVLWGLVLAREAEVEVREAVIAQAANFLNVQLIEATHQHDLQSWMLHALAVHHAGQEHTAVAPFQRKAFDNLWKNRDRLNAYTRALLALSAHHYGFNDRAEVLVRNLENGVIRDEDPSSSVLVASGPSSAGQMGTAHWGEDGIYWRWSDGGVEATAFALKALLAIDPENQLVEPVTNWLIKNRRGAQWSNTRDTAICLLTLNDYLRQSGELETELDFAVQVSGTTIAEKSISKSDLFSAPSRFEVPREHLRNGRNEIVIKRTSGSGPLYFSAAAEFFSLEEPVPAAGHEIFVKREYYRLTPQPTLLQGHILAREKMQDGDRIASSDRVEVVVTVEAKNNYEYLVFEDLKPAGLEAVEIQSGSPLYARELNIRGIAAKHGSNDDQAEPAAEPVVQQRQERKGQTGRGRYVYQELRDRKVALFLDKLPQGIWEMRYELRAEVPGEFHALPVLGHAMYVPEIRCNSTEMHLEVTERAEPKPAT